MRPMTARLGSTSPAGDRALMLTDLALIGCRSRPSVGDGGLADELVAQGARSAGAPLDVDVLWDLRSGLRAAGGLAAADRLRGYAVVVVVARVEEVLLVGRRLTELLANRSGPPVVVVLGAVDRDDARTAHAFTLLHEAARAAGTEHRLTVLPAATDAAGALADRARVAATVLLRLRRSPDEPAGAEVDEFREVAVDHSLARLRGSTGDLQRAVLLAQNAFDAPYAQLNLVSRGVLRSLVFVGRSSDGLQQSLSAEAVRSRSPLLIADTSTDDRCTAIPETRGPGAIRYYVGHPVHDPGGQRIGVLCVLDTEPRPIDPGDDDLIRDIALLAEGELLALLTRA